MVAAQSSERIRPITLAQGPLPCAAIAPCRRSAVSEPVLVHVSSAKSLPQADREE